MAMVGGSTPCYLYGASLQLYEECSPHTLVPMFFHSYFIIMFLLESVDMEKCWVPTQDHPVHGYF